MSRDKHNLSVKYEDIISRPKETVAKIFDSLGIDLTNCRISAIVFNGHLGKN